MSRYYLFEAMTYHQCYLPTCFSNPMKTMHTNPYIKCSDFQIASSQQRISTVSSLYFSRLPSCNNSDTHDIAVKLLISHNKHQLSNSNRKKIVAIICQKNDILMINSVHVVPVPSIDQSNSLIVSFCTNKMKNKLYHTVATVPESYRNITERGKINTPITQNT